MAMSTMNPELPDNEKIEYLRGQVEALFAFILAVLMTHPDLAAFEYDWMGAGEFQEANTLPRPVTEAQRDGMNEMRGRIAVLIQAAKLEQEARRTKG